MSPAAEGRVARPSSSAPGRIDVVFLLPRLDVGGAERVVLRTASGLDPSKFSATVVGLSAGVSTAFVDELDRAGVPWVSLGAPGERLHALWRCWQWFRHERCDVLFTLMFHANLTGRLLRRGRAVPRLVNSERVVGWESRLRKTVNRATVGWVDALTTNSEAGRVFWATELGLAPASIHVIHNGVDTGRFRVPPETGADLVTIGNLSRLHVKNDHETLLRALAIVKAGAGVTPWRALVAGDGEEHERLLALRDALGLRDEVAFLGHQAPDAFLHQLDIYVQCSLAEGLSNATLEAMACGRAVVATDVGGTAELVGPDAGVLVPPRAPDALAAAILQLLHGRETRATFGRAARARVERQFSIRSMVAATEALLLDVAARPARASI